MVQATCVMLTMITGQLFGASNAEGRGIETFTVEVPGLPASINQYAIISYLPNSRLDRLRITEPILGAPVCTAPAPMIQSGISFVEPTAPIAPAPLKVATIGQILNANPFGQTHPFTARKWLAMCVGDAGIDDLVLDQSNEPIEPSGPSSSTDPEPTASQSTFKLDETAAAQLLVATVHNKHNLELVRLHLPAPTDAQRREVAELFDEVLPPMAVATISARRAPAPGFKPCTLL